MMETVEVFVKGTLADLRLPTQEGRTRVRVPALCTLYVGRLIRSAGIRWYSSILRRAGRFYVTTPDPLRAATVPCSTQELTTVPQIPGHHPFHLLAQTLPTIFRLPARTIASRLLTAPDPCPLGRRLILPLPTLVTHRVGTEWGRVRADVDPAALAIAVLDSARRDPALEYASRLNADTSRRTRRAATKIHGAR